jgi:hypothetical protein
MGERGNKDRVKRWEITTWLKIPIKIPHNNKLVSPDIGVSEGFSADL